MESGTQAPNEKIRSEQAKQKAPEKKSDSNDYLCRTRGQSGRTDEVNY